MSAQQVILFVMQLSIFLTVFGFGLDATIDDVLYVVRRPKRLLLALLAMFVVMPLLALALDKAFEFRPEVEIALVVLALSPIPPLLPRKQGKAAGSASFGMGLMVTMALLSIAIIPLGATLMGAAFHRSFTVPPLVIAKLIVVMAVLPLLAGMAVAAFMPRTTLRIFKPVRLLANLLLPAAGLVIVWGARHALLAQVGESTVIALVVFIVAGLVAGHLLGGPAPRDRAVLALSTASRHPGIAIALASANFPDVHAVTPTIGLYLLLNLVLSMPYVMWHRRRRGVTAAP
jgi:BASS family bile acid:Na+ symporter